MKKVKLEEVYAYLEEWEYLEYGKTIPKDVFETILECAIEDGWDFLGGYLAIKEMLEENGFLSTSAGVEQGCLRIYSDTEVTFKVGRLFENNLKKLKKLQLCLQSFDASELDEEELRKKIHLQNKLIMQLSKNKNYDLYS